MPRLSSTGLRERPARLSSEKFCMLRAPIWIMSAYSSTSSSDSLSTASVTMQQAEALANLGQNLQALHAQALERVGRGARLVGAAAEELRAGRGHLFRDGEGLVAALDGAGPGDDGNFVAADGRVGVGEAHDGVVFLHSRLTSL